MRNLITSTAVALTVAALLAGCSSGPAPTPTTTPRHTPSATASATPAAASTSSALPTPTPGTTTTTTNDVADPATWIITEHSVGPVEVGAPQPQPGASEMQAFTFDTAECPAGTHFWESANGTILALLTSSSGGIGLIVVSGHTHDATPRTAAGIGIGDTVADIRTAYPNAVKEFDTEAYGQVWVAPVGGGTIAFEIPRDSTTIDNIAPGHEMPTEYCG